MKWLLHIFRKLTQPSGAGRLLGFGDPKWQVHYSDGNKSRPMHYDVACDYASMFGGEVKRIRKVNHE
jgi:hypothetical protein